MTTKKLRRCAFTTLTVSVALGLTACGGGSKASTAPSTKAAGGTPITLTTPAPTGRVDQVVWDLPYGEPGSLDPLKSYALAENTVLANVCDSLLRMGPDLDLQPGLASAVDHPTPTTYVFTIRSGVKFWDGQPLTAGDVAYSLQRQIDPKNASFYDIYTSGLLSAKQTGADQVTLKLKKPNELVKGMMASGLGAVIEKAYAEKAGAKYGTPGGGIMCSGPFKFKSWESGSQITLTANPEYWDAKLRPKVGTLVFKFITDASALTNGLQSGELDGAYVVPQQATEQLQSSSAGTLSFGKNLISEFICPLQTTGPLSDPKIRRALSLSIDRAGIAEGIFFGHAAPMNWLNGADSFGYEKGQWQAAYDSQALSTSPQIKQAKQLVADDPSAHTPIVIAVQAGDDTNNKVGLTIQSAARQAGLDVQVKVLQASQYVNLVFDEKSSAGIDAYIGSNGYIDQADPLEWAFFYAPKGGTFNTEGYDNPKQNALLDKALAIEDPKQRMKYAVPAAKMFMADLPLIPIVEYPLPVFMSKKVTGAPTSMSTFVYSPWAAELGAK